MLKTSIIEPETGKRTLVDSNRALLTETKAVPPTGAPLDARISREFLTDANGSSDMTVLASPANPIIFSAEASQEGDRYVKALSFTITGTDMNTGGFGDQAALTNPCLLRYLDDKGAVQIAIDITTNFDLLRIAGELMPGVGDTPANALKVGSPAMGMSTDDAYVSFVDFHRVFGFPYGILLRQGTIERLEFVVQDDLTGVDSFDCRVYGMIRLPNTERA